MKRILFLSLISFVAAVSAASQTAPDSAELTHLLNEFLAGAGKNDAVMHDRFWADDLIYTRSAGVRTNKEELMKGVRSAPPKREGDSTTVYTAEDIRILQYGNTAVVAFKLVSNTTKADGTKTTGNNLNTGTFVKRKGEWRAVAWQSTVVPLPQPTAAASTPAETSKPVALTASTSAEGSAPKTDTTDRKYTKGPRGGCYYMSASGEKKYVDKKFCP
ncbi:MAG: YybH family protein [Pyrinomonadaceae bacterium]